MIFNSQVTITSQEVIVTSPINEQMVEANVIDLELEEEVFELICDYVGKLPKTIQVMDGVWELEWVD